MRVTQRAKPSGSVPTFREFASEWLERQNWEAGSRGSGLSEKSRSDLQWRLAKHLLPAFDSKRLNEISIRDVDNYRLAKVREGRLSPSSINKTLTTLAAILELAAEYELITQNPARGRRRRLALPPRSRTWIDREDHIVALLDAARCLDDQARAGHGQRRALLATLIFAGLRVGEAFALRWRDVDLARGTISIRMAKTPAGQRTINILPVLSNELGAFRALADLPSEALAFGTTTGRPHNASNVRTRVLAKAVGDANEVLLARSLEPLPRGLTLHALRRTFASILFAIGEPPPYVMSQMGHTTPNLPSMRGRWTGAMASPSGCEHSWKAQPPTESASPHLRALCALDLRLPAQTAALRTAYPASETTFDGQLPRDVRERLHGAVHVVREVT